MSKYFSYGMKPYVYEWAGRAAPGSKVSSELGATSGCSCAEKLEGVLDVVKSPLGIGALLIGAVLLYPRLFGSGQVRVVRKR